MSRGLILEARRRLQYQYLIFSRKRPNVGSFLGNWKLDCRFYHGVPIVPICASRFHDQRYQTLSLYREDVNFQLAYCQSYS